MFTWGPRPKSAQKLVDSVKTENVIAEEVKFKLHQWYNDDKRQSIVNELYNEEMISLNIP